MTVQLTQAIAGMLGLGGTLAEDINIRDDIHNIVKQVHSDKTARTALRAIGDIQQGDFDRPFRKISGTPGGPTHNNDQPQGPEDAETEEAEGRTGGEGRGQRVRTIFRPHTRGLGAGSARAFQVQEAPSVGIARPKPGEQLGPDGRVSKSNLRLVQVSNASFLHELGKYNSHF